MLIHSILQKRMILPVFDLKQSFTNRFFPYTFAFEDDNKKVLKTSVDITIISLFLLL